MRPVNRSDAPANAFTRYQDAKPHLETSLGCYCSFCERRIEANLAVEHVQPKSLKPELEKDWSNFLLACSNCNSVKSVKERGLDGSLWPHLHNTLLALSYRGGLVRNILAPDHPAYTLANTLIEMVGLDRYEAHIEQEKRPSAFDKRAKTRQRIWELATHWHLTLSGRGDPEMWSLCLKTAIETGCFSIWFEVFSDNTDFCRQLIAHFPGTAPDCFEQGRAIPKPNAIL